MIALIVMCAILGILVLGYAAVVISEYIEDKRVQDIENEEENEWPE